IAALQRRGAVLRHAPDVRVVASARLDGRAPGGMAACLRSWVEAEQRGEPLLVEAPEQLLLRLRRRALVRSLTSCAPGEQARRAAEAQCDPQDVTRLIALGANSHALVARFAPAPVDPVETEPVEAAIARLQAMIASLEGASVEPAV